MKTPVKSDFATISTLLFFASPFKGSYLRKLAVRPLTTQRTLCGRDYALDVLIGKPGG